MKQNNNCSTCNFRFFGMGCTKTGKRVTDHEHCEKWEPIDNRSKHDQDAIDRYYAAGYELRIDVIAS